jgi:7-carboxy-7-deazaguanine synthase
MKTIPIHETFISIQGEGIHAGKPTTFVRVVGCNLACPYCDTGYRPEDDRSKIPVEHYSLNELKQRILYLGAPYVCFTGGEPLLYEKFLYELVSQLCWEETFSVNSPAFTFETNGTVSIEPSLQWRTEKRVAYTMDVKPFALDKFASVVLKNLSKLDADLGDEVKIVIASKEDLYVADDVISAFPSLNYILSPVHDGKQFTTAQLICDYVTTAKRPNIRVGVQIHKILNQR